MITYLLYRRDGIKPRLRLLVDSIWLFIFAVLGIFDMNFDTTFSYFGMILIFYSMSNIRDGLFFESKDKRRKRRPLPIIFAALLPISTLVKINEFMNKENSTFDDVYNLKKDLEPNLEVFIHVRESGFGAIGHVDLAFDGRVISFGNYDNDSYKLFTSMGEGVLFDVERESYIEFCKNHSHKTLLGFGLHLNEDQLSKVKEKIDDVYSLTYDWTPSDNPEYYATQLSAETDVKWYKFKKSKFRHNSIISIIKNKSYVLIFLNLN